MEAMNANLPHFIAVIKVIVMCVFRLVCLALCCCFCCFYCYSGRTSCLSGTNKRSWTWIMGTTLKHSKQLLYLQRQQGGKKQNHKGWRCFSATHAIWTIKTLEKSSYSCSKQTEAHSYKKYIDWENSTQNKFESWKTPRYLFFPL